MIGLFCKNIPAEPDIQLFLMSAQGSIPFRSCCLHDLALFKKGGCLFMYHACPIRCITDPIFFQILPLGTFSNGFQSDIIYLST